MIRQRGVMRRQTQSAPTAAIAASLARQQTEQVIAEQADSSRDNMEAFDALPAKIRALLMEGPRGLRADDVRSYYKDFGMSDTVALIKSYGEPFKPKAK